MAPLSPYVTALKLGRPKPAHIKNTIDQDRVTAYWTYWDIFRNVEEAWTQVLRDDDGNEIARRYVPAARTIIEATNRYLGRDITVTPEALAIAPDGTEFTPDEAVVLQLMKLFTDFWKREEVPTKFASFKRWGLIRGDAIFHLMADDTKPEGTRLRLVEADPSSYFPIEDPSDATRIDGVYLVTIVEDDEGNAIAQRQSYLKAETGTAIISKLEFFETDGWDDRLPLKTEDLKPVDPPEWAAALPITAGITLPAQITSIPVYHYRNNRSGTEPFGVSELQGIETLLAGINQTATDEDIAIGLQGIGVYWTTSGKPRDESNNEQPWIVAPASMIELEGPEDKIGRLDGVGSIQPLLDHSGYLESKARETTGTPDVAVGRVDVQVAESGIALGMQMSPITSKNEEKELELKSKLDQMWFDMVTMWLPAYEGLADVGIRLSTTFGDPLPVNRAEFMAEVVLLLTNKIISIEFAQKIIQDKLGYKFPKDMMAAIVSEQAAMLDATGVRLDAEAAGGPPPAGA